MRLEELLQHHLQQLSYEQDSAFEAFLQNAASTVALISDNNVKDAYVLASASTIEHIEISRYETLLEWAKLLNDELGIELLRRTLEEEAAAQANISSLAVGTVFKLGLDEKAAESGK